MTDSEEQMLYLLDAVWNKEFTQPELMARLIDLNYVKGANKKFLPWDDRLFEFSLTKSGYAEQKRLRRLKEDD